MVIGGESVKIRPRLPPSVDNGNLSRTPTTGPYRVDMEIISFGYSHGDAPDADLVLDTRVLRNPADDGLRSLTGHDQAVQRHV